MQSQASINAPQARPVRIDKDRPCLHRCYRRVGGRRIYQARGGPDNLRWFWSLTVNSPMTRSNRVATLEEAKAQFQRKLVRVNGVGEPSRVALVSAAPEPSGLQRVVQGRDIPHVSLLGNWSPASAGLFAVDWGWCGLSNVTAVALKRDERMAFMMRP